MPIGPGGGDPTLGASLALPFVGRIPVVGGLGVALAGLVLSHGVSFVQNWLLGGERRDASPASIMPRPYGRVVVLHVAVLVGGFAVQLLGAPLVALVLMVALKIGLDASTPRRLGAPARAPRGTPDDRGRVGGHGLNTSPAAGCLRRPCPLRRRDSSVTTSASELRRQNSGVCPCGWKWISSSRIRSGRVSA